MNAANGAGRSSRVRHYTWAYLTEPRPEPVDVDPERDLGYHEDDLPGYWRERSDVNLWRSASAPSVTGGDRADYAFDQATHWVFHALYAAGFSFTDTHEFMGAYKMLAHLRDAYDDIWEYRRFGIPVTHAIVWRQYGFAAHLARVFIDAGYMPQTAADLHRHLAQMMQKRRLSQETHVYARTLMAVLDYRMARDRAFRYGLARIPHEEVALWEQRRKTDPNVDEQVRLLGALNYP